ncbi:MULTISPECIES: ABC transporter permease [Enterococcus]|uniref:Nickel transport system permease n=1 Tax=Candidatus Enterococcus ferrettii TaxID=2815324 RepID=A0ABV0ERS1_9ENTE|nr:ABC transporter permease subunit [Enterococcus sp. 665A]MBO1342592.1 ABC transporter permease subunit [Enterococcus sp. 665A]
MKLIRQIANDKLVTISFVFLIVLFTSTIFANILAPYDPNKQDIMNKLASPSWNHWLGTDQLGRDIFSRLLYGGRVTILLSFVIILLILIAGFIFGSLAGMAGGSIDAIIMRTCDWLLSLPSEMISLCIIGILGPSMLTIVLALTIVRWPWYIKMIRSEVMKEKGKNYVLFSLSSGKNKYWVFKKHMLRSLIYSLIIYSTLDMSAVVMSISALSFLGIGIQPPTAEWGRMLNDAREVAVVEPWQMIPAGAIIFIVVAMLNYIGDALIETMQEKN